MFYLLVQMALYMLVTLALGIWLGWLLWRKGYIHDVLGLFGMQSDQPSNLNNSADLAGDYKKLRDENSKLASDLSRANSERNTLQNDLDACRAASRSSTAPAPVAAVASAGVAASKPAGLSAPRGGKADDLKEIKGIGPKLEKMLHGMGFYHFDQIAKWGKSDLAWVDDNLEGFKGRASRDNWISQASQLRGI